MLTTSEDEEQDETEICLAVSRPPWEVTLTYLWHTWALVALNVPSIFRLFASTRPDVLEPSLPRKSFGTTGECGIGCLNRMIL